MGLGPSGFFFWAMQRIARLYYKKGSGEYCELMIFVVFFTHFSFLEINVKKRKKFI